MQQALRKHDQPEPDPTVAAPATAREEVERRAPLEDYSKSPCEGAIDWVTINGFRSIRELHELPLTRLNVLVGVNGAGKSNFLEALLYLGHIADGRLRYNVLRDAGSSWLLHSGKVKSKRMELGVSFDNGKERYQICLEATQGDSLVPTKETLFFQNKRGKADDRVDLSPDGSEAGISARYVPGKHSEAIARLRDRMGGWRVHHFNDTTFSSPMCQNHEIHQTLGLHADGGNLAAFLFWLQQHHKHTYSQILGTVQISAPFIKDFVFLPVMDGNPETVRLRWKHADTGDVQDVHQLSDGTLRLIALTTLLLQPAEFMPSTVFIDEPEIGLHPDAISTIGGLIRSASHRCQAIVATQSQYLLNQFDPEEVLVTELIEGETRIHRLDPARVDYLLEDHGLGQIWVMNYFEGSDRSD